MCGIAGIVNLGGVDPGDLLKMSRVLRHRGPDDEGFLLAANEKINYYKGDDTISAFAYLQNISEAQDKVNIVGMLHRRLSILDLSPAGHQPMAFQNKYELIFNGEIYNYREIKKELASAGQHFISESDTEVLLAAYHAWGRACVNKFVGMWAFALYDREKKELFLSRDRFGIKPLYFHYSKERFAFASEIKALLELEFIKPEADMTAVYEFISFGATADPSANLFKLVQVLPPAHNLIVDLKNFSYTLEKFYDLSYQVMNYTWPAGVSVQNSFNELLNNSIDLHLRSDVPVGSALSGGLDSSTVVAIAASKMQGSTFKTFTAAYADKEIDESYFAKKVIAGHKNVEAHFTHPSSKNYWLDIDKLIWHQDLPVSSTSMFAQWEVMKLAKEQNTKVLLDGQGADEILGGYYNFAGIYLVELLKAFKLRPFILERSALRANFAPNIDHVIGKALYYFLPEFLQRSVRAKKRLGMNFIATAHKQEIANIHVPPRGGKTFREQSLLSNQFGLQDLLRYEDRNSMAFSVESRVPFLDHRLVEFCIALQNEWKIRQGWTKYILRKTAEPILDKEVTWRKYKMGFLTPQRTWKDDSQKEINAFLEETPIPDFINKEYFLALNKQEFSDPAHLSEFWKMISFVKWAGIFNVSFN